MVAKAAEEVEMTSAALCCGSRRSIHECRRRCRSLEPEAGIAPPPPASRVRRWLENAATSAAIRLLLGVPALSLTLAGVW